MAEKAAPGFGGDRQREVREQVEEAAPQSPQAPSDQFGRPRCESLDRRVVEAGQDGLPRPAMIGRDPREERIAKDLVQDLRRALLLHRRAVDGRMHADGAQRLVAEDGDAAIGTLLDAPFFTEAALEDGNRILPESRLGEIVENAHWKSLERTSRSVRRSAGRSP